MMEGEVLERILVVVCSHLGMTVHRRMVVGTVAAAALEAGATWAGSLVIAVDTVGVAAQDHNAQNGS